MSVMVEFLHVPFQSIASFLLLKRYELAQLMMYEYNIH